MRFKKLKEDFILQLHEIGAIKFGDFILKSGMKSPFYFDLRDMISYPKLLNSVADLLVQKIKNLDFDYISGIPYTALPIATLVADKLNKPLIYARKEEKTYGTKNSIIGKYKKEKKCVIIDDLITTGESIMETAEKYRQAGLITSDFVVIIDRSRQGTKVLKTQGFQLHALIDLNEILEVLQAHNKISQIQVDEIKSFVTQTTRHQSEQIKSNPLTQTLIEKIKSKKSNLVLSLDVDNQKDFFKILKQTAEQIVMLKTHVDILKDFDDNFLTKLRVYAQKYDFLIFEDRKFADIGNTVKKQYQSGIYKIKDWSDFITVHAIPGEGILQGLFEDVDKKSSFLLAKMSSEGNLMNETYTRKVFSMGAQNSGMVSGYIVHANSKEELQRLKNKIPNGQLLLMPGVKLEKGTDAMGQQYTSVQEAIEGGADLIIVGRGIIESKNPKEIAKKYRKTAWQFFESKI